MANLPFYPRLAVTNLKNNRQTYLPYLLTCIMCIVTFYTVLSISLNPSFETLPSAWAVQMVMAQGVIIIAIFSAILVFYTNGFLIKRRKREIGLYNILGMEKRHLGLMMLFETIFTAFVAIVIGLLVGALFSWGMFAALRALLHLGDAITFSISPTALASTAVLFLALFFLTLLSNLRQVRLAKPVELLHGGEVGERQPKSSVPLTILGIVSLGGGYAIAILVKSPMAAILLFLVAVLLVIIGTYALFTAGSIALLRRLRANKRFYYQPRHFVSVSGLLYRMRQNAKGLASICILSTMAILTIATTVSLYLGQEGMLRGQFPYDVSISQRPATAALSAGQIDALIDATATQYGVTPTDRVSYQYTTFVAQLSGDLLDPTQSLDMSTPVCSVTILQVEDYNALAGTDVSLQDGQALAFLSNGGYGLPTITLGDATYSIKSEPQTFPLQSRGSTGGYYSTLYLVLPQPQVLAISQQFGGNDAAVLRRAFDFNVTGGEADTLRFAQSLQTTILPLDGVSISALPLARADWYSLYGGFLFLGLFVGTLFMVATALIIYYKQLSEGYEDRTRFKILQQVGMSKQEVRGTIRSQIMTVFFAPLLVALLHTAFAFPVMRTILTVFGLTDILLFFLCTAGVALVFSLLYFATYSLTARTYYKLVGHTI